MFHCQSSASHIVTRNRAMRAASSADQNERRALACQLVYEFHIVVSGICKNKPLDSSIQSHFGKGFLAGRVVVCIGYEAQVAVICCCFINSLIDGSYSDIRHAWDEHTYAAGSVCSQADSMGIGTIVI